jgi:hypothetical protein
MACHISSNTTMTTNSSAAAATAILGTFELRNEPRFELLLLDGLE